MTISVPNTGVRIFTHEDIDRAATAAIPIVQQSMHLSTDVTTNASASAVTGWIATKNPIVAISTAPLVNQSFQSTATILKNVGDPLIAEGVRYVANVAKSSI